MAYVSHCLIEICNTHTFIFSYRTRIFSQFTSKSLLAWNAFDLLLWVIGPGVMIVNIGTEVAPVNIAFSSSRSAALIERKMLHYTTLSIKLHHCTMSGIRTQVFTLSDFLAFVSIHCLDQKQHSNRDSLIKSFDNKLQTCADTANEYLQAYYTAVGVKSHAFCSLRPWKGAGYTMFLFAFVPSN